MGIGEDGKNENKGRMGGEYGKTSRKGGNNHAEQQATTNFFTDHILYLSLFVSTFKGKNYLSYIRQDFVHYSWV
jgi:hypothetical protein